MALMLTKSWRYLPIGSVKNLPTTEIRCDVHLVKGSHAGSINHG